MQLTVGRAWVAFLCLTGYLVARHGFMRTAGELRSRTNRWTLAFGSTLAAANVTYYVAVSKMDVAVAITIQYTAPLLVVLWVSLVERRSPGRVVIGAAAAVALGVALLTGLPGHYEIAGVGLAFAAASAFAFAAYTVIGERVVASSAVLPLTIAFGWSSLIWILLVLITGNTDTLTNPDFRWWILFLGTACTVIPFALFVVGIRLVSGSVAVITSTLEPLSAAVFGALVLEQLLDPGQIVGCALVLAGVVSVSVARPVASGVDVPPAP